MDLFSRHAEAYAITKSVTGRGYIYDDHSTITGGGKHVHKLTEGSSKQKAFALIGKLAYCWTSPYKVLVVGPGKMEDGCEVGGKFLEIVQDEPGRGNNARVSAHR